MQIAISDVKIWGTIWSKFQTLDNQFEQGSGRFVGPEPALNMGPRIRGGKNKTRNTPKKIAAWKQTLLSAERSLFGTTKKLLLFLMALGCWPFRRQTPQMTTVKKEHCKTWCFVLLFGCSWMVVVTHQQKTSNKHKISKQNNKQTNKQTNKQQGLV